MLRNRHIATVFASGTGAANEFFARLTAFIAGAGLVVVTVWGVYVTLFVLALGLRPGSSISPNGGSQAGVPATASEAVVATTIGAAMIAIVGVVAALAAGLLVYAARDRWPRFQRLLIVIPALFVGVLIVGAAASLLL